jgi:formamidopyrimidine-DNA glycosylase
MPELPDVEGFHRLLAEAAEGARIERVEVFDEGVLRGSTGLRFRQEVAGRTFAPSRRHGKWLVAPLRDGREHHDDDPSIVFHFGMAGGLVWSDDPDAEVHRHDRVVFRLPGGTLHYRDMRKLQGIRLLGDDDEVVDLLSGLGPDASRVTGGEFAERLKGLRGQVKPALMDQETIAGLGNLLTDEILWQAGIHPARPVSSLSDADRAHLYRTMRSVIRRAMRYGRVPDRPGWLTGRRDLPAGTCPRCGTPLRRSRVGGRGTVWCPQCQPR